MRAKRPYHVIHSVASLPYCHGVVKDLLDWCLSENPQFRNPTWSLRVLWSKLPRMRFFRARTGFLPCAGWHARIMLPYPIGGYRRQPLPHVWLIGSRRCIGSGSAAMCPWCRCSASRKHDIAVLTAIVRTAEIKPPVYQFAQSRWSRFKEKLRKFALANWLRLDFAWASFVLTP